jgi:hypothetical protein
MIYISRPSKVDSTQYSWVVLVLTSTYQFKSGCNIFYEPSACLAKIGDDIPGRTFTTSAGAVHLTQHCGAMYKPGFERESYFLRPPAPHDGSSKDMLHVGLLASNVSIITDTALCERSTLTFTVDSTLLLTYTQVLRRYCSPGAFLVIPARRQSPVTASAIIVLTSPFRCEARTRCPYRLLDPLPTLDSGHPEESFATFEAVPDGLCQHDWISGVSRFPLLSPSPTTYADAQTDAAA